MEFTKIGLTPIVIFNLIVWLFFTLSYFYQFVYIIRVIFKGDVVLPKAKKKHTYAFVIAAHNEEPVIGNLVKSILTQDYDGEIDCYVVADACTDDTETCIRKKLTVSARRYRSISADKSEGRTEKAVIQLGITKGHLGPTGILQ